MSTGSFIIANDLIGVVTEIDGEYLQVYCDDGKIRKIFKRNATEFIKPHAYALLLYTKLLESVK